MRLSETKVMQLIESEPPKLVLVDDVTGAEVVLTAEELPYMREALDYFEPHMQPEGTRNSDDGIRYYPGGAK